MSLTKTLLAASLLLSATSAHMFINSPEPIPGTFPKDPLEPSGSNFPCHGVELPTTGGQSFAAGSKQMLSFELAEGANTAVHGGGSCQLSLTYETDPVKQKDPKNWKVIYSMLGGCPAETKGNLPMAIACKAGATDCVNQFPFTIPKGVKNGHAILAWTWFNNVGNREMYMNCVNAELTGGDGSEMSDFPAMFVANLAAIDTCPTTESINVEFPNPGKYVTSMAIDAPFPLAVPTGEGCAAGGGSAPAAPTYGGGPAESQASPTAAPVASSSPMSMPEPTSAPAPTTAPAPTSAPASAPPAPSAAPPAYNPPAAAPYSNSSGTRACAAPKIACSSPGAIVCIDAMHFGICDNGCAVPQAVAPGTTCSNGTIMRRGLLGRRHAHGQHGHF
ncbi:unnamed protein product [Zymoseptoria tritici ST99CH_3D1]|nr:unnamed protein product [Zymoseptoria tritici ST99CH_3D1]